MVEKKYSWMVIVSLIVAIATLIIGSLYFLVGCFLFGLSILLGIFSLFHIKRNNNLKGKVLAWICIIFSILGIIGLILTQPIY